MNKNKLDVAELHELIGDSLTGQADRLGADTLARLRHARLKAVNNTDNQGNTWLSKVAQIFSVQSLMRAPVAQASVAMLVAIFSVSLVMKSPLPTGSATMSGAEIQQNNQRALSEMDVLMSNEDIEFLDNLEIYEWLVAEYG